jgi:hypothetical protein
MDGAPVFSTFSRAGCWSTLFPAPPASFFVFVRTITLGNTFSAVVISHTVVAGAPASLPIVAVISATVASAAFALLIVAAAIAADFTAIFSGWSTATFGSLIATAFGAVISISVSPPAALALVTVIVEITAAIIAVVVVAASAPGFTAIIVVIIVPVATVTAAIITVVVVAASAPGFTAIVVVIIPVATVTAAIITVVVVAASAPGFTAIVVVIVPVATVAASIVAIVVVPIIATASAPVPVVLAAEYDLETRVATITRPAAQVIEVNRIPIVAIPIIGEPKRHDRQVDPRAQRRQAPPVAIVSIAKIVGENPAANAVPPGIAPVETVDTPENAYVPVVGNYGDHRKTRARSSPHVQVCRYLRDLGKRRNRNSGGQDRG